MKRKPAALPACDDSAGVFLQLHRPHRRETAAAGAQFGIDAALSAGETFDPTTVNLRARTTHLHHRRQSVASTVLHIHFDPWPADHPFAYRSIDESRGDLHALKLEDTIAFHRDH